MPRSLYRHRVNQQKLAAGAALKRKGRPPKDCAVIEKDKVAELRYILDRKEAKIKRLETENELMRDFLSLTESNAKIQFAVCCQKAQILQVQ